MLQKILYILKQPFIIPSRMNRVHFINKLVINFLFCLSILLLQLGIFAIILSFLMQISSNLVVNIFTPLSVFDILICIYMFLSLLSLIIYIINYYKLHIARLHDMNLKGWWVLLSIIPLFSNILEMILFTIPGSKGLNKYGEKPEKRSKKEIVFAVINSIIYIMLLIFLLLAINLLLVIKNFN
jgi:uncharacterized membrane protein YhaH (DUF805 family)